jgi:hypothetical protein
MDGVVPMLLRAVSVAYGAVPTLVGAVPTANGAVPLLIGAVPMAYGAGVKNVLELYRCSSELF